MATSSPTPISAASPCNAAAAPSPSLRGSRYEQVASALIATLVLLGLPVFCMFVAWLGDLTVVRWLPSNVPLTRADNGGIEQGDLDNSMELDSVVWRDVAAESDLDRPDFQRQAEEVLAAVSDIGVAVAAPFSLDGGDFGRSGAKIAGTGDRPGVGHDDGPTGIPPEQRWEIVFPEFDSLPEYARQLDFFRIELIAIGDGNEITAVTGVAQSRPTATTVARAARQDWLRWSWQSGRLRAADRELVARAGVALAAEQPTWQLYSPALEAELLELEKRFKNLAVSQIRRTVFRIVVWGDGYAFEVVSQAER